MPTEVVTRSFHGSNGQSSIWKFMFVAILALLVSGIILGGILGAFAGQPIGEWIWAANFMTFKSLLYGGLPAIFLGAPWYAYYYRTRRIPFPVYLSAAPVAGVLIGIFDSGLGLEFGAAGLIFLLALHVLIRVFPGLIE
jgi:hypothetical protein